MADLYNTGDPVMSNYTAAMDEPALVGLVGDEVREVILVVNLVVIANIIAVFGVSANIINITVFTKHGFNDSVNISLTALAVGDIGALITMLWFNVCVNPWFVRADLPFLPLEIQSLTGGFPHYYFTRVTGFITAFIAFERCLCVALPLKVKRIITMKVALIYNVFIFVVMLLSVFPVYYTSYYDWKLDVSTNKTVLGIFFTPNKDEVQSVSLFITNFLLPFLSFFVILLCTVVIGYKLKSKAKWRQTAATVPSVTSGNDVSTKEKKVVVMITVICCIFIVSFPPLSMVLIVRAFEPGFSITGQYSNLNWIVVSFGFLMNSINSSINIVVYYKMSTKYKETLQSMFKCLHNTGTMKKECTKRHLDF